MSLSTISGLLPSNLSMPTIRVPSMTMPNLNLAGRSTQGTFGFARFSNERVSTVNIERSAADSTTTDGDGNSSVERGEIVDDTIQRIDTASLLEKGEQKVLSIIYFINPLI